MDCEPRRPPSIPVVVSQPKGAPTMAQQYSQPQSRRGGRNRGRHYRDGNSSRWRPFADDDTRRDWPSGDRGWPERDYQDDTSEWSSGRQGGGGYGGPASYEYRGSQDR